MTSSCLPTCPQSSRRQNQLACQTPPCRTVRGKHNFRGLRISPGFLRVEVSFLCPLGPHFSTVRAAISRLSSAFKHLGLCAAAPHLTSALTLQTLREFLVQLSKLFKITHFFLTNSRLVLFMVYLFLFFLTSFIFMFFFSYPLHFVRVSVFSVKPPQSSSIVPTQFS